MQSQTPWSLVWGYEVKTIHKETIFCYFDSRILESISNLLWFPCNLVSHAQCIESLRTLVCFMSAGNFPHFVCSVQREATSGSWTTGKYNSQQQKKRILTRMMTLYLKFDQTALLLLLLLLVVVFFFKSSSSSSSPFLHLPLLLLVRRINSPALLMKFVVRWRSNRHPRSFRSPVWYANQNFPFDSSSKAHDCKVCVMVWRPFL